MNEVNNVPEYFSSMVFTENLMRTRLSSETYNNYLNCITHGTTLSRQSADEIACAMKDWAISLGATHFTHWFQPMTGVTAEKHDSFIAPSGPNDVIMELSGKELSRGEADASSFPSGGLRATFEARGYTAWDITSYAFVKDKTLYIPTIFCSYSGETLDKKTPLLRSVRALDKECVRILRLFGDSRVQHVKPQAGAEQEYFLIDKNLYMQREDLRLCGRTLFGAKPSKGQELDDHYYGAIRPKVTAFMHDLDEELWKLGVYAKTEHNEAAPSQHELAEIYSDVNTACDHNQLIMELLKTNAEKHDMVCLLNEKPFNGVNGSGKHNNWSIATDLGDNLLKPGSTPSQNAQFLLFLAAFIKGVDEYQDMIRASVAYPGNDLRLGGNEAPPAIISVFVGDEIEGIIDSLISGKPYKDVSKKRLKVGIDTLPEIPQDTTDRNRTSPIAFTGNKFELRMCGSSQSIAGPNTVINTVMAEELSQFADILEKESDFNTGLQNLIITTFKDHQRIIFNGNGYGEEWISEAKKRGLSNIKDSLDAYDAYIQPQNVKLFSKHGILTEAEMRARYEIYLENYCKVHVIEATTLLDMCFRKIIPSVSSYENNLSSTIIHKREALNSAVVRQEENLLRELSTLNAKLYDTCTSMQNSISKIPQKDDALNSAAYIRKEVVAKEVSASDIVNKLETKTSSSCWPYPTYNELLFSI